MVGRNDPLTEGPYKLPPGWRWVKLGKVAQVFSGTWGKDPALTVGKDRDRVLARVIRVSDIKETLLIDYDNVPLRSVSQREVEKFALRDGDIVVVKSSGSKTKVISGRAALFRQQKEVFIPSNFVFAVRSERDFIHPVFLWHWLNSKPAKQYIEQIVSTFTYPNLKKSDYVDLPIPLPPLSEQRRIVAWVEEFMERVQEAKRLREEAKKDADRLMQAALAGAFPRPGEDLPPGWKWVKLGEVCETKMGGTPRTKVAEYWSPPEIVWVTPEDLEKSQLNRVLTSRRKISQKGLERSSAKLFPKNTVLLSTTATIGKVGIAEVPLSANQQITGIMCSSQLNHEFLAYFLLRLGEIELKKLGGTATSTHINQMNLRTFSIPLPPLSEQRRIVAYLDQIQARVMALKKTQEATEAELHHLEQAILNKAFRGVLTSQKGER